MKELTSFIKLVRNIYSQEEGYLPLHIPTFNGKEKEYVMDTLQTTMVSSVGAYVDRFEESMAKVTNVPKSVAVVNGTSGLQVALNLVGVQPGEEVITQSLTFVATANAIHHNHAQPIFIDVDKDTMGMSPEALRAFLLSKCEKRKEGLFNRYTGKRIAACLPMHTFGFLCRIEEIVSICNEFEIPVVEDAAEALGSSYKGQSAGTFGTIGVFSFNGNKIITSGGGGALVSKDQKLMERAKYITNTAKKPHRWEYYHDEFAYNFRMPNLNAALACAQLEQLDVLLRDKGDLYSEYQRGLETLGFKIKTVPSTTEKWNCWLIALEMDSKEERDVFLKKTNESGIMTRPIWQLMHRLPMYKNCQVENQENAEYLENRIVNIPSSARIR